MHTLKIHLQAARGDEYVGLGSKGSLLISHYLILNDKDLMRPRESRDEDPAIHWSIVGEAPTGFMELHIRDPWPELLESFPLEERLYSSDEGLLVLPLRRIEFVRYEIPPPLTELEREHASLPL